MLLRRTTFHQQVVERKEATKYDYLTDDFRKSTCHLQNGDTYREFHHCRKKKFKKLKGTKHV